MTLSGLEGGSSEVGIGAFAGKLKNAMRLGCVKENAAEACLIKMGGRHKKRVKIPTKPEVQAMLAKARELWPLTKAQISRKGERHIVALPHYPFIVTAIFTGLRMSELRGLSWDCLDLRLGKLTVSQRADYLHPEADAAAMAQIEQRLLKV